MMHFLKRPIAVLLSLLLALMPLLPAQAAMIGNQQIISQGQSHQTRDSLQQQLEHDAARQQLQAWGVSPDQIRSRIDSLTDTELARINQQVDELNAGGNILGILLIIFIVFVITDVIGATDIFPFIHPVK
ncbi:MAG: PA2779 family protein [Gammaproteobacteria bacterium]|nr:PA2779 family protein [Gammaproteobacteria bacterium]